MLRSDLLKKAAQTAKKYRFALLIAAAAAVLLLWPGGGETEETAPDSSLNNDFSLSRTERRMEEIISKMDGCGEVSVMLTLDETKRDVLAQNSTDDISPDRSNSSLETVVIGSSSRSGESVVVLKSVYPVYRGALVVCTGAVSSEVVLRVRQAVCALTGLSSDRVTVCPAG
ncbi:MAG: stage III sporulation protein AG [Oscillospiraceae bacterium]|nr:stage III sporulation protein AG [Oscillospiraceae bacterium]